MARQKGGGGVSEVVVILIGGLGKSQLGTIEAALKKEQGVRVVVPSRWDGYRADIRGLVASAHSEARSRFTQASVCIICHSFGCDATLRAIEEMPEGNVSYVAFVDPIGEDWRQEQAVPDGLMSYDWFVRNEIWGPPCLRLLGPNEPIMVQGSHNECVHDPLLIDSIIVRVLTLAQDAPGEAK